MNIYYLFQLHEKYLGKDYFYLIAMSIYHIQIAIWFIIFQINFKVNTFLPMILPDEI